MIAAFKYFFIWLVLYFLGMILFIIPGIGLAYMIDGNNITGFENAITNQWAISTVIIGAQLLPLFVFWKAKYTNFNFSFIYDFGERFSTKRLYLWAAIGCIGSLLFCVALQNYITMPDWDIEDLEILKLMAKNPLGNISMCLLGPFLEEVVFRGAIERRLLEKFRNPWIAIVISAIFFAVAHMNLTQGLTAIILGCVIGWVYYRTRNLWPCVLMHVLNNTIARVATWFGSDTAIDESSTLPDGACITMLLIGLILLFFTYKEISLMTKDRVLKFTPKDTDNAVLQSDATTEVMP